MLTYFVFLKSKLKTKQTTVNTNPAVANVEYMISIAKGLRCTASTADPSYGAPPECENHYYKDLIMFSF